MFFPPCLYSTSYDGCQAVGVGNTINVLGELRMLHFFPLDSQLHRSVSLLGAKGNETTRTKFSFSTLLLFIASTPTLPTTRSHHSLHNLLMGSCRTGEMNRDRGWRR